MTDQDLTDKDNEKALFQAAMRDVMPLPAPNTTATSNPPVSPLPRKQAYHERQTVDDTLSDHISIEMEAGDEWAYMLPGMPHHTIKRLRRGHWKTQRTLDLHGFNRDEARRELNAFVVYCLQQNVRCVKVIHGKGLSSKNREPVLKTRIGNWLMQCTDVLAFCQARPEDGGSGAVLILLKAKAVPPA